RHRCPPGIESPPSLLPAGHLDGAKIPARRDPRRRPAGTGAAGHPFVRGAAGDSGRRLLRGPATVVRATAHHVRAREQLARRGFHNVAMATARKAERADEKLLRRLMTETDESAAAELFVQLCRESRALRHWLWEDFSRDAATRERFARRLRGRASNEVAHIGDLGEDTSGSEEEIRKVRASFPARIFGGLTWAEVEALIGQFRAGRSALVAFLLALQWRRAGDAAPRSAHLLQSAAQFLDPVFRTGDRHRLNQLRTAVTLVDGSISPKHRRTSVGPSNWWKLHLLFYILRHPKPSYATRELVAHLKQQGLRVAAKGIRRFCARHGI